MKKIVFISGIQVFPPQSGGQIRTANLCRSLVNLGFCVDIYSFTGRKKDYINFKKSSENSIQNMLNEYTNRLFFFGIIQLIFYRLKMPPIWLTLLTKLFLPSNLKNKINKSDILIADFPYLYPISEKTKKPFILNTHNAEFELFKHVHLVSKLIKKIEVEGFKKAKNIFFCNVEDQEKYIKDVPNLLSKSFILPNGIDLSDFKYNNEARTKTRNMLKINDEKKVFLFTGSQYYPNKEALDFLYKWSKSNLEELEALNILILIVGSVGEQLIDKDYFKVVGKVDNILPYFSASDYAINPIMIGSGTNVKMSEFIAAQLPILTTSFGCRGFNLVNRQSCWFFERNQLLKVIKEAVLHTPDQRKTMTSNALSKNIERIDMLRALKSLQLNW